MANYWSHVIGKTAAQAVPSSWQTTAPAPAAARPSPTRQQTPPGQVSHLVQVVLVEGPPPKPAASSPAHVAQVIKCTNAMRFLTISASTPLVIATLRPVFRCHSRSKPLYPTHFILPKPSWQCHSRRSKPFLAAAEGWSEEGFAAIYSPMTCRFGFNLICWVKIRPFLGGHCV